VCREYDVILNPVWQVAKAPTRDLSVHVNCHFELETRMRVLVIAATALFLNFGSQAQVRKCTGPDGKVTYSDVLCSNPAAKESSIDTSANTLDHSGLRKEAQRMRETEELDALATNTPRECRFKFHAYGDPKGKALSEKAKTECIRNIVAAKQGKPPSKDAYALWKDHFDQTAASRRAIVQQIGEAENARRIAASNESAIQDAGRKNERAIREVGRSIESKLDRPMTCTKSALSNDLICK
jgi:hypothetical protein